jgi:hypothetical protein
MAPIIVKSFGHDRPRMVMSSPGVVISQLPKSSVTERMGFTSVLTRPTGRRPMQAAAQTCTVHVLHPVIGGRQERGRLQRSILHFPEHPFRAADRQTRAHLRRRGIGAGAAQRPREPPPAAASRADDAAAEFILGPRGEAGQVSSYGLDRCCTSFDCALRARSG